MRLTATDLAGLAEVAIAASTEAGQMIQRSRPRDVEHKAAGASLASQVLTEVDRRSEEIILDHLRPTVARFELGLLTEEREDDGSRLTAEAFWCIDPLDGTLPFIEGRAGWAVSIALVSRDGTPLIGVVHDPVEATVVQAIRGAGVLRDGATWTPRTRRGGGVLSLFADRSFLERRDHGAAVAAFEGIAADLGVECLRVRTGAGAVMNAMGVLDHAPACYVKDPKPRGGGNLWDFASTACVFHEVGAVATDRWGGPLDLNRADTTAMNHRGVLFASDDAVAARVRGLDPGSG